MPTVGTRTVGEFVWNTALEQWRWDAGMYELHGCGIAVSTGLVLEHKQDDHRDNAAAIMRLSTTTDQRFSNYHGIVDTNGRRHSVLVVGQAHLSC